MTPTLHPTPESKWETQKSPVIHFTSVHCPCVSNRQPPLRDNKTPRAFENQAALAGHHSNSTFRAPFQELSKIKQHLQVTIPTVLSECHSKSFRKSSSTCRSPFQKYFQSAIPRAFENQAALAGHHSNSTFRAPFQELSKIKQHVQVTIPTVLSERHSKSFPTPPTQKPSRHLYNYMAWCVSL